MTELSEIAIAKLKKLPDARQDEVATMILKQIKPKDRLSSSLAKSIILSSIEFLNDKIE